MTLTAPLAACQAPALQSATAPRTGATLRIVPQFARHVQAIAPLTAANVKHLQIGLFSLATGSEVPVGNPIDLLPAQMGDTVTFANLAPNTTYRVRGYAYATGDTSQLISSSSLSSADVTVGNDTAPALAPLTVQLNDVSRPTVATYATGFNNPNQMTLDGAGNLYVANDSGSTIQKVTPQGVNSRLDTGGLNHPHGIAYDGAHTLYVADYAANRIVTVDTTNGTVAPLGVSVSTPCGLAYDGLNTLYVGNYSGSQLVKITLSSLVVTPIVTSGLNNPYALALDGKGTLYIAGGHSNTIQQVALATNQLTTLAGTGAAGTLDGAASQATFSNPNGIAVDGLGNLFVAEYDSSRVRRIDLARNVVTTLAGTTGGTLVNGPALSARFSGTEALAINASGTLFVSDQGNGAIRTIQ